MTKYIGLCGYRGAGKSTLARNLCSAPWGIPGWHRTSLALPLKEACSVLYGRPVEEFLGDELKSEAIPGWGGLTYREAMVQLGMSQRDFRADFWLRSMLERTRNMGVVVVDDIRFLNEARCMDLLIQVGAMPGQPAPEVETELEDVFALCHGSVYVQDGKAQVGVVKTIAYRHGFM